MHGCRFSLAESYLTSPPLANSAEEAARFTNVAKVMSDHRMQIDELLRHLVQRNLDRQRA
jgi:hypothetical protein